MTQSALAVNKRPLAYVFAGRLLRLGLRKSEHHAETRPVAAGWAPKMNVFGWGVGWVGQGWECVCGGAKLNLRSASAAGLKEGRSVGLCRL